MASSVPNITISVASSGEAAGGRHEADAAPSGGHFRAPRPVKRQDTLDSTTFSDLDNDMEICLAELDL